MKAQHESLQQTVAGGSLAGSTEMWMVMLTPTQGPMSVRLETEVVPTRVGQRT